MDTLPSDLTIFFGRSTEFVAGIDNEGIDFSQLADFIDNDGTTAQNFQFADLSTHHSSSSGGKLLNVIVENNKRNNNGHSLPESPPDSSSEHPYSPQDGCEQPSTSIINSSEGIYSNIYKTAGIHLNPIDNLILSSHIVVADQNNDDLVNTSGLLQDNRLLGSHQDVRTTNAMLNGNLSTDHGIILTDNSSETNRQVLLQNVGSEQGNNNAFNNNNNNNRTLYEQNKDFVDENKHLVHLTFTQSGMENSLENNTIETLSPAVYTNLQSVCKKRKLSQESTMVKSEPDHCTTSQLSPTTEQFTQSIDEEYASSETCLSESQYQCIRFNPFQQANWHTLCDQNLTELSTPHYRVDADKGFNFSNADDAFVCQKKNHFQITCHVQLLGDAQFVKTPDGLKKISSFHLHFYGVKHDCPTQTIRVEQSQSDRSKKPFHPVLVELVNSQVTKVTVGRLHFSETTSNNMRKKGKPNPEQRYFQLVVGLHAHTTNGNFPIISHASQKIIVRASNPGQFESDVELCWQKGQTSDSVFHNGKVGINTDRPDECLVVHGNIKITGHIIQPSDIRAKKNIVELNTAEQLKNVQKLRVVRYEYEPALAAQLCREKDTFTDTGVIAQEVAQILPEAVKPAGDLLLDNGTSINNFLLVNKERIFMENIGAVKELCKVTDNLENRIDQLERINKRLNKLKRGDSLKSDSTVNSSKHTNSFNNNCKCTKRQKCKYCERHQDVELCSNKFIQVVIVILVLIMALCLVAITTLYLFETTRQKNILSSLQSVPNMVISPKKPTLSPSFHNSWTTLIPLSSTYSYIRYNEINKINQDSNLKPQHSRIIGSPKQCQEVTQTIDESFCPIYCCAPNNPLIRSVVDSNNNNQENYSEKRPIIGINKTKSLLLTATFKEQQNSQSPSLEKVKISKPFHSNDIDKLTRIRRDYDITNEANVENELPDDQQISITLEGKNFTTHLNQNYLNREYNSYNFTYSVPLSKYMPDKSIKIVFRFHQLVDRKIQNCPNNDNDANSQLCVLSSNIYNDALEIRNQEIDQTKPTDFDRIRNIIKFDVDIVDFQWKIMTYRVGLSNLPSANFCNLQKNKLGLDFVVYNFHFYRDCDD